VGREADAVAPAEEAVALHRELAAENPAFVPNLARSFTNLDRHLLAIGNSAGSDAAWQEVLGEHDTGTRSTLQFYRMYAADAGDPRTAAWVVEACRSDDRGLLGPARDRARTHRAADPQHWDAAWAQASGEEPPDWLTVDTGLLAVAKAWIDTPSYEEERDHLAAHPELRGSDAETAIEEALLRVDENAADRYRQLWVRARADGVDAAYRPVILLLLANRFTRASPAEQRQLLSARRPELLDEVVRDFLADRAEADENTKVTRAVALLEIARRDVDNSTLQAGFRALENPAAFAGLLHAIATGQRAGDLLQPLAQIALTAASTLKEAAQAELYLAVAVAIAGDIAGGTDVLAHAVGLDSSRRSEWIGRLADVGAGHPAVFQLIEAMIEVGGGGEQ
jgi:hypothetical protein